jgi:hypothetical protein
MEVEASKPSILSNSTIPTRKEQPSLISGGIVDLGSSYVCGSTLQATYN